MNTLMKPKLLGYVGVDFGQLMITDPCYRMGKRRTRWKSVP